MAIRDAGVSAVAVEPTRPPGGIRVDGADVGDVSRASLAQQVV